MNIKVKKRNGRLEDFEVDKINASAQRACEGITEVSASEIVLDAQLQLYDKITTSEIDKALVLSAREKIEKEPNYSYAAAKLLLNCLYKEVFKEGVDSDTFKLQYRKAFIQNTKKLVKEKKLSESLLDFDLKKLSEAMKISRDDQFKYLGIQILYDRYFIRQDGKVMESPQAFWMRVSMGLAINEEDKNEKAIEFYNLFSQFLYTPSTPTLFNSGTTHSQLSSCYLNTFDDSIDGIFDGAWQEARKSKYAGGLGLDVTPFRSTGSHIQGTNGISSGLVPWLKIYNDLLVAVNQGGKRPGAGCAYLEPWHLDFEDFLNLRRNTGDDRLRCHDMNTASWVPDEFMRRVEQEDVWYFFDPKDTEDENGKTLHDCFGAEFDERYNKLCNDAEEGLIKNYRIIPAKELWKKMLKVLFETSHPWNTFKDPCNIRYTNQHEGAVHSSNLCTEITLHTKSSKYKGGEKVEIGETAVCNLGSVNLKNHLIEKATHGSSNYVIDYKKLESTIHTAIRILDNVIDLNFYPTKEAEKSNLQHRPIGLGMMGLHDILHMLNIQIDGDEAVEFNDKLFEFYSCHAIYASSKLAKEKGAYKTYEGSLWSQNILPVDSFNNLMSYRKNKTKGSETLKEWGQVRKHIAEFGMRNSNVMAIAPTATIGYINGIEQSIEPNFSVLFVYENKSGNFFITNEHFVRDMKDRDLWSTEISTMVKSVDGDLSLLNGSIPEDLKEKYKTAFDRDMLKLIECNSVRQKWIDQAVSFNLYNKTTSLKYLNDIYMASWKAGLKTTYYLRNRAASKVEKANETESTSASEPSACSIEAMKNGEICESCQ
jgi:ribonucleoside-diphosphate reductase alpha chain|tara:strand:- start:24634 stop:27096 length:2463 start_codon:yes stop_codon:yes gene_type:complete